MWIGIAAEVEKEIFFDLNLEEEEMDFGDNVILRVVEDGAIAREKDNDEKDECAIIIVVVVVVAIFVLLFSLSFPYAPYFLYLQLWYIYII